MGVLKTALPEKLRPLGVSKTQIHRKTQTLTNYVSEREKGGCVILAPSHDIAYTIEMNKQVSCFQISMISDDIT